MKQLLAIAIAVLIVFVGFTPATKAQKSKAGIGTVVEVIWPSVPNRRNFMVAVGDKVQGRVGWYTPPGANRLDLNEKQYNMIKIVKPIVGAEIIIVYDSTIPGYQALHNELAWFNTRVSYIAENNKPLKRGDTLEFWLDEDTSDFDVRADVTRGDGEPVAVFEFIK